MADPTFVVFLNGSYGVGKSSALDHLGDVLAEHGQPFSLMDVDWYHRSWPPSQDDPDNVLTEAANMTAVWNNYRQTGPRQPVVAGVMASEEDRQRYEQAFALPVRSVRLVASATVTEARLRRRYTEHQSQALHWHLQRHLALSTQLALRHLDDLVIGTDEQPPRSVAERVADFFGLLPALPRQVEP
ncbi:hypothetical protein [Auraticoccus monumenti]|uniref:hypothetical protein n=1 Tax=Auraticoccus monumenti TaxID=675864 RepID=UPI0012F87E4A|nr:hypothetical protein [Auraticoccus monumenti]